MTLGHVEEAGTLRLTFRQSEDAGCPQDLVHETLAFLQILVCLLLLHRLLTHVYSRLKWIVRKSYVMFANNLRERSA